MDTDEFYKKMIEVTKDNPELYEIIQAIIIIYSKMDTNQKEYHQSIVELNKKILANYESLEKKIKLKDQLKWYKNTKVFWAIFITLGIGLYSIVAIFFGSTLDILMNNLKNLIALWNTIE